ncbi:MAG TPA: ABC transporter ATP-binding protein [Synergistaceae bacterium]|nr:ABC transporter ATP-binding protein [Synergistaceae bacterium]HPJ24609.1 ABC transporter ATP-binding protein [Synergistaceae bacterium]HPQ36196.1 ABC transporter ATP-binding protein [Synergistaceae bacterium]
MKNSQPFSSVLSVEALSKRFGGLQALLKVSFEIREKEILGLLGPNGAGKTTCFNIISGVQKPTEGKIFFQGEDISGLPPHQMASRGIGRTYQIVRPFGSLTVLENVLVALGMEKYGKGIPFFSFWDTKANRDKARQYLKLVGLEAQEKAKALSLPLGNLRRLELARALALEPSLLLLDETFSGLRHEEISLLEKTILGIRARGITILLIEHNMRVAMSLSDRIVVLDHGEKIAEGLPEEIAKNDRVIDAYLGRVKEDGLA